MLGYGHKSDIKFILFFADNAYAIAHRSKNRFASCQITALTVAAKHIQGTWAFVLGTRLLDNFNKLRIAFQLLIVRQEVEWFADGLRDKNTIEGIVMNIR